MGDLFSKQTGTHWREYWHVLPNPDVFRDRKLMRKHYRLSKDTNIQLEK